MGQGRGDFYEKIGVTGPTEFGELPRQDRVYWNNWFEERVRKINDDDSDVNQL